MNLNAYQGILESALLKEIESLNNIVSFKEGDTIIEHGQTIKFMPMVLKGNVKVMRREDDGNEILLYYLSGSDICALAYNCCMESKQSSVTAIAEDDVELIKIPQSALEKWIVTYPSWRNFLFRSFNNRFDELLKAFDSVIFKKLDERLVEYLRNKSKMAEKHSFIISHQQIANELGSNRVVISRLLKLLENEKKILIYRNEIKLLQGFPF